MTFRSIANSCLGDAAQARGLTYQLESPRALAPACQPTSFPAISFNTTYVLSRELSNHLWTNNLTVCLFFPVENALPLIVSFRKTPLILQCLPVCVLSCVQLFETPWAVARQAPLSMGFFRQESWSELPFPTPGDLPVPGIELTIGPYHFCPLSSPSLHEMFSLGISNFLEEISSLSHYVVFLYFFALIAEEDFLISPCYSLELCIQVLISFLFSFAFHFLSFHSYL